MTRPGQPAEPRNRPAAAPEAGAPNVEAADSMLHPRRGERLRIAYFLSPSEHFAGIERVVHEIATGLVEQFGSRVEVHVLFSTGYDDPVLQNPYYTPHVLRGNRLATMPRRVRATLRRIRPDVLVVPQVEASVLCWFASRGLGVDVFIPHLHGNPMLEEREGTLRTRFAFRVFRRFVAPRVAGIFAVAPSLGAYAARALAPRTAIRYVPNPVRPLRTGAEAGRPDDERFRFVTIGRIMRQKGHDVLLSAVAIARLQIPDLEVTIVGDGPDRPAMQAMAERLRITDVVRFVGYTSTPGAELARSDCFVLPSRWEGFGMVLVEAMQFGLPLIASDCRFGPSDIVTAPTIGELVPPEDAEALAAAMVRAAHRPPDEEARQQRMRIASGFDRAPAAAAHFSALIERVERVPRAVAGRPAATKG
jgi:glycosyltransferase involved in cell wall biosynthesis